MEQTSSDDVSLYLRRDVTTTCLMNYVIMRLECLFIINNKCESVTLGDEVLIVLDSIGESWSINFSRS